MRFIMIQTLLEILYVSLISISWGLPVIFFCRKNKSASFSLTVELAIFSFFCGLALISLCSSFLCLFSPLRYSWLLVLSIPFITTTFWILKRTGFPGLNIKNIFRKGHAAYLFFFLTTSLLFILLGSGQPAMEDTDLYHLQIIRWNQEYGTIDGLANLFPKYGTFSSWLELISFFALPFPHQNFLFLNVTLSIWTCFFLVHKIAYHGLRTKGKQHSAFALLYLFILLFMLLEWNLFRGNSSSANFDFIVTALILFILLIIIEDMVESRYSSQLNFFPLVLLAASVPFFKMSGAPVLLILFFYLFISKARLKIFFTAALILLLFALPFLTRNYLQTGYFFYPYTILTPFAPPWQLPEAMANKHVDYITVCNRYLNQSIPPSVWLHPAGAGWVSGWPARLTLFNRILIFVTLLEIPCSFFVLRNRMLKDARKISFLYGGCLLVLVAWFFLAPDPRFAYGFMLVPAFLIPAIPLAAYFKQWMIRLLLLLSSLAIIAYGAKKFSAAKLIQPDAIAAPPYKTVMINGSGYHMPEKLGRNWNIRCYYTGLPCICEMNPYLELMGKELKDGFRMKPITDSSFILNFRY